MVWISLQNFILVRRHSPFHPPFFNNKQGLPKEAVSKPPLLVREPPLSDPSSDKSLLLYKYQIQIPCIIFACVHYTKLRFWWTGVGLFINPCRTFINSCWTFVNPCLIKLLKVFCVVVLDGLGKSNCLGLFYMKP